MALATSLDSGPRAIDFARVFDAAPSLFVVLAPDLTIVAVNDAYLQSMGLRSEIVSRKFLDVLGASDFGEPNATTIRNLNASLQTVLRTKVSDRMPPQRFDVRRTALSGGGVEERHWRPVNAPVVAEDGSLMYIVHCVGESTERARSDRQKDADEVRTEATRVEEETVARQAMDEFGAKVDLQPQTLLESDMRFRAIYDNALDAMLISDDDGNIIDANLASTVLFGRERPDILALRTVDLLPEPEAPTGPCTEQKNDPAQRGERRIVRPDGRVVHVEYSSRSAFLPGRHLSVLRDVEDRRRTEELLRFLAEASAVLASSLDYASTLENLVHIVVPSLADWAAVDILAGDGSLRRAAVAHTDPSKDAGIYELGKLWPSALDDESGPGHVARTMKSELAADASSECLSGRIPDATALHLARDIGLRSWMHVPLIVRSECIGVLTFAAGDAGRRFGPSDVTLAEDLARRAASALDHARSFGKSRDALEARDEFLQIASHELNTPLTSLQLQAVMLQRAEPPEKHEERLRTVERQIHRMSKLVAGLLDVTRAAAGRLLLAPSPVELGELVREAAAAAAEDAKRSGTELRVSADTAAVGEFDGVRLAQAVTNCVFNAIKYGAGKPVDVSLEVVGEKATITVRDEGIGIDPEMQGRIFERFVRGVSAQHFGGFGLGLWIARQIVEGSGGTISVASLPGKGATFRIELPLIQKPAPLPFASWSDPSNRTNITLS